METIRSWLSTLVLVLAVASTATRCKSAEVPLLDLVDESVALCVEIPRLESTWSSLEHSRLADRLRTFPLVERFLSGPGFQKWKLVDDSVAKLTGKAVSEQLLGLFSESLVIAVYLPDGKKPQGAVIARARDESTLKLALNSWSVLEPQHVDQQKEHRGQAYIRRAKSAKSAEVVFYSIFGRTLVLSDQETLVQQAIDFYLAATERSRTETTVAGESRALRDSPLYRTSRARLADECAAVLYVNARAWDKALDEAAQKQTDVARISQAWRSVASVAAGLRLEGGVVVDLVVDLHREQRPAGWSDLVSSSKSEGTWSQRIPQEAVLAISGRLNVQPLVAAWLAAIPESKTDDFARGRRALQSLLLGRDLFDDMLPRVVRDWTIYLAVPTDATSDAPPFHVAGTFVLESPAAAKPTAGQPAVDKCLDNALQFGLNLAGAYLSHKRDRVIVTASQLTADGIKRSLQGPSPWTPTYVIAPDRLTVSTSESHLPRDPAAPPATSDARGQRLTDCERRYFAGATQLVWFDSVRSRDLLARHGKWLAGQFALDSDEARDRLAQRLSRIAESLKVFDAAFLAASLDEDHVRIVVGAALDGNE